MKRSPPRTGRAGALRTPTASDSCSHGALARLGPRPGWMASRRSGGRARGVTAVTRVMLFFHFELLTDQISWQLQLIIYWSLLLFFFLIFWQTFPGASFENNLTVFLWASSWCKCQNWNDKKKTGNLNLVLLSNESRGKSQKPALSGHFIRSNLPIWRLSVFRDAILQIASGYLTYWYSGASAKTGMKKKNSA